MPDSSPLKVLITGAYGLIGNITYAHLAAQPQTYTAYGLVKDTQRSARSAVASTFLEIPPDCLRFADLSDFAAVQQAVTGMDVVVHLAADPDGAAPWESILTNNIIGAQHIFEACRIAGVRRIVYGSTNQVVFGYGAEDPSRPSSTPPPANSNPTPLPPITHEQPPRPINLYSASKVFGESLAHVYAYRYGLSCLCLRIGWVTGDDKIPGQRARALWCSQRDIVQIIERCINAPASLRFDIFFGHSNNRHNFVDLQHARDVLGYSPQDSADDQL